LTIDKLSIPLGIFMLFFTAVIPLLGKRPVLERSHTGDFHKVQEAAGIPTDLLGMRGLDKELSPLSAFILLFQ
jgi:hypothetical protein